MTRFVARVLGAALLSGLCGCGATIPSETARFLCQGWLEYWSLPGPGATTSERAEILSNCRRNFFGAKLAAGEPLSTTRPEAGSGVTQSGEALLTAYGAEGRVQASDFPRVIVGVPYQHLKAAGADLVDVSVSTQVLDQELGPASQLFDSMAVTLRTAEDGPIADTGAHFATKDGGAAVVFEGVEPRPGLEAVLNFAGGAVRNSTLILNVGATLPVDDAGVAAAVWQTADESGVLEAAPAGLETSGPAYARLANRALKVNGPERFLLAFYRAKGSVKAKRFPKVVLDLPSNGKARVNVDAGLGVLTEQFKVPKKKERPTSITVDLLTVKGGKAKRVSTAKANLDKNGNASVRFRKIDVPKNGHLRAVIRLQGKKVKNALIIGYGNTS